MNFSKLKAIVIKSRKDFENKKINKETLKELYLNYNKIEEIDTFLDEAEILFPKLNCGLASLYLKYKLKKGVIINGKYKENNHTFLLMDNIIIDITSDQYDGPKIYIGEIKHPWKL
ncbi:hypothetical protein J4216_03940 [Candidatus Woesearchaeota archaeon]|nr:hypothetical protein [Candidatus Woesearchaeota archaeon]